jgi:hypothetical protein
MQEARTVSVCKTGFFYRNKGDRIQYVRAETAAESGIVSNHAITIFPATPQRTADNLFVAPTPMMAPVIVWVVLTLMPPNAVASSVIPPAVSAQNPSAGFSLVTFCPMVFTILHPPNNVPVAIAMCEQMMTQNGT